MASSHHKYSPAMLAHLRGILQGEIEKGMPRAYEVRLDGARIIPRTENLDLLDSLDEFLHPEAKSLTVILYKGRSQHNDTYILYLKSHPFLGEILNGPTGEDQLAQKLEAQEKDFEMRGLKKLNQKLKRKLKGKRKYIQKLENSLLEQKASKFSFGKLNLGELSSYALEGLIRRNTHLIAAVPGAKALAGAIEEDNISQTQPLEAPEGKATFKEASPALNQEDQSDLALGKTIRYAFPEDQSEPLQTLLSLLAKAPHLLPQTLTFIQSQNP